jgi:hypothetical protein
MYAENVPFVDRVSHASRCTAWHLLRSMAAPQASFRTRFVGANCSTALLDYAVICSATRVEREELCPSTTPLWLSITRLQVAVSPTSPSSRLAQTWARDSCSVLTRAPLNSGGGSPSPLEMAHHLPHEFVSADQQNLYKMSVAEDVRKSYIPQGIDVGIDMEDSA